MVWQPIFSLSRDFERRIQHTHICPSLSLLLPVHSAHGRTQNPAQKHSRLSNSDVAHLKAAHVLEGNYAPEFSCENPGRGGCRAQRKLTGLSTPSHGNAACVTLRWNPGSGTWVRRNLGLGPVGHRAKSRCNARLYHRCILFKSTQDGTRSAVSRSRTHR